MFANNCPDSNYMTQQAQYDDRIQPAEGCQFWPSMTARQQVCFSEDEWLKRHPPDCRSFFDNHPRTELSIEKRNARERKRVRAVNLAYSALRQIVPIDNPRGKRISKVKTLKKAIEYIERLSCLLQMSDESRRLHSHCAI